MSEEPWSKDVLNCTYSGIYYLLRYLPDSVHHALAPRIATRRRRDAQIFPNETARVARRRYRGWPRIAENHMSRILVADDHPLNRHFLTTLLSYYGHEVREAAGGVEALELARRQ